jgi:hypothetical protein
MIYFASISGTLVDILSGGCKMFGSLGVLVIEYQRRQYVCKMKIHIPNQW